MANTLLFFGATADIVGLRVIEFGDLAGIAVSDVLSTVTSKYPGLASHKLHISINQEFAAADQTISDGDEIAIFTAVSGG